jgi:hypothetical protein
MASTTRSGSEIIADWPEESREAASLVIKEYGEPHEVTDSLLIWEGVGRFKRVIASRAFYQHDFPVPHTDSVESVVDYHVPIEKFGPLAEFDGSVVVERTAGEASARCHDVQANSLALNLTHDIVTGKRTVDEARAYYGKEFLDYRRNKPTPYMDALTFTPSSGGTADADHRILSQEDLDEAVKEGKAGS